MLDPSLGVRTIEVLGCLLTARNKSEDQLCKRKVKLAEVALLGDPMVHLHVDVGVVVSVPWCAEGVCPQPLQIRRKASGTGAGNKQVSSEIVVQRSQIVVYLRSVLSVPFIPGKSFVCRLNVSDT